ncbi:hypothetical protein QJQ45_015414 [Haematococcus lacustris]|nr:hypothetical protein QJQ45_015414 [Haematococcus lacustris]
MFCIGRRGSICRRGWTAVRLCRPITARSYCMLPRARQCCIGRSTSSFIGRFVHQNQSWAAYKSGDKGRVFYLNTATSKSQWTDPRKVDRQPSVLLPFLLPFLFVLGVGAVYIGYVYFTSPHLLMGPGKKRGSRARAVMKPDKKSAVSPRAISPKRDAAGAAGKPAAQKGE